MAELVKIDPKSVGVGQYQHDVSQKQLGERLDFVVETAVNQVGVNLNTASAPLLQHVAGLNKTIANNIVAFREENGAFDSRQQLKKVPRLGPKAFEQSVGFMRIAGGKNILDNTDIHPESYPAAKEVLALAGLSLKDIGTEQAREALGALDRTKAREATGLGKETLQDIIAGLTKPGRDPRDDIAQPLLRQDVLSMEDLKPGMELQGNRPQRRRLRRLRRHRRQTGRHGPHLQTQQPLRQAPFRCGRGRRYRDRLGRSCRHEQRPRCPDDAATKIMRNK